MYMKFLILFLTAFFTLTLASCDLGPDSPKGFSLPEGDINNGQKVFLKYECLSCHQLEGFEQPETFESSIKLGGKTTRIKTYAELLTSVINPSHKFARGNPLSEIKVDDTSKMTVFNDVMTVTELVDLVTFLQPKYELEPFDRTGYRHYGY